MQEYALGLGSNKGDRHGFITRSLDLLCQDGRVSVLCRSAFLENPAMGGPPGMGTFVNAAAVVATELGPHQLLALMQRIEHQLGRTRTVWWGPRTIDMDILLRRDGFMCHNVVLDIPHPGMPVRDFVLEPLAEIAGDWFHPEARCTVHELWNQFQAH